jgi:NitT/TauT family transport system substrate-binding protein
MRGYSRRPRVAAGVVVLAVVGLLAAVACQGPGGERAGGGAGAAGQGAGAGGQAAAQAPVRIRAIYSSPTGGQSMMWVTKEAGFFEQNDLDVPVDMLRGNQQVLAALISGEIDLAQNTGTSVVEAAAVAQNLVMLGAFTDRYTYKLMVDPSIRQPADLRGLPFASSQPGSTDEIAARKTFAAVGVDPRDIDFISFQDQNGRVAAMRQGIAKGTLVVPPNDAVLKKSGLVEILDTADLSLPYVGIAPSVRSDFLRNNRPALERYMRAMVQGIAHYKQNPEFAKQVVGKYMQLDDPEVLEAAVVYYTKVMPRVPYVPEAAVRAMLEDAVAENPSVRDIDPATLYDNSMVRKVEESGLVKELYRD